MAHATGNGSSWKTYKIHVFVCIRCIEHKQGWTVVTLVVVLMPKALCKILLLPFLGVFAKLRKTTISSCLSVHPSVRMEQRGSHWADFHEILYWVIFEKNLSLWIRASQFYTTIIQQDAAVRSQFYITATLLYMFRVLSTPIIRSTLSVSTAPGTGHTSVQLPLHRCMTCIGGCRYS